MISTFPETAIPAKAVALLLSDSSTNVTPRTLWTPWTDACWTAGSCASRWLAMAGPLHPSAEEAAAAVVDGMAEVANEVVPVIATVVVPARPNVLAGDSVGHTPGHGLAPGTDPVREANHPAARIPDPAAP